jgi:hypothetical protein
MCAPLGVGDVLRDEGEAYAPRLTTDRNREVRRRFDRGLSLFSLWVTGAP